MFCVIFLLLKHYTVPHNLRIKDTFDTLKSVVAKYVNDTTLQHQIYLTMDCFLEHFM